MMARRLSTKQTMAPRPRRSRRTAGPGSGAGAGRLPLREAVCPRDGEVRPLPEEPPLVFLLFPVDVDLLPPDRAEESALAPELRGAELPFFFSAMFPSKER